jgi:hypothetical protein
MIRLSVKTVKPMNISLNIAIIPHAMLNMGKSLFRYLHQRKKAVKPHASFARVTTP